jgi:hypothetical protein
MVVDLVLYDRTAFRASAIALVLAMLQSAGADERSHISAMSIAQLKDLYVGCEQAAMASKLSGGDVMYCSLVYEELKQKAFEGDFGRIRSWRDRQLIPLG